MRKKKEEEEKEIEILVSFIEKFTKDMKELDDEINQAVSDNFEKLLL